MLVLSRKQLRSVAVGGSNDCRLVLNITMVELQGGSVRLDLEVDTDSHVCPREVSDRICPGGPSGCPTGFATGQAGAP